MKNVRATKVAVNPKKKPYTKDTPTSNIIMI